MKKKHEKHYLRSDGNGGLNISHSVAITSIIVMLFLAIIPAAVAWGALNARVDNHYEIDERHEQELTVIEERLDMSQENMAVVQTQISNINSDVIEIKSDVKELLKMLI